jgi:aminoglycoside phosphotransferase (APT) family kinase protein
MHGMYAMFKVGFLETYTEAIVRETGNEGLAIVNALEDLMPKYVMGRDEPYTVTHGDYRLDNLLFSTPNGGVPCAVVDWQTPGHGNGIGDLSYFIGAGLLPDDRKKHEWELVDLYIHGLESYGHVIDHGWVKNHYKRESFAGLVMAVIASQIVGRTERGDKMFEVMATRHIQQAIENDALSLL